MLTGNNHSSHLPPTRSKDMLKYNGKGFIPGIPARDLTDDEVKKYGGTKYLLGLGIYESPKKKVMKTVTEEGTNHQ